MKLIKLFLSCLIFSSMAYSIDCNTLRDDAKYLYKNNIDIDIEVFTRSDGYEDFTVTRNSDNKILRNTRAKLFSDASGLLSVDYTITEKCGGVDIEYTVTNSTAQKVRFPLFIVDGITHNTNDGELYTSYVSHYGNVILRDSTEASFADNPYPYYTLSSYPGSYAPIGVTHDGDFAMGSSICNSILEHGQKRYLQAFYNRSTKEWRHIFGAPYVERDPTQVDSLDPSEVYNFKIALRFSDSRYWLKTILPYKEYFNSVYGLGKHVKPKDRRAIQGLSLAFTQTELTTPRGYSAIRRVDRDGLGPLITSFVDSLVLLGYERSMLWNFAGIYAEEERGLDRHSINYPPQFMGDLLPNVESTVDTLDYFKNNGINLGFWWGRSGQIPSPIQWDPDSLVSFDVDDSLHREFARNEILLAVERGANDIGLDAFGSMSPADRLVWIDSLLVLAPNVRFVAEGGGTNTDFIHSKMAVFFWPANLPTKDHKVEGPCVICEYLNPGQEIQMYLEEFTTPGTIITKEYIQDLIKWGYTPIVMGKNMVDITGVDTMLVECFDGMDNDNDGLIDFPADTNCMSANSGSEGVSRVLDNAKLQENFVSISPNPFNPILNISVNNKISKVIQYSVYNMNGSLIHFVKSKQTSINWNAGKFSSGIYLIKVQDGKRIVSNRAVLLK